MGFLIAISLPGCEGVQIPTAERERYGIIPAGVPRMSCPLRQGYNLHDVRTRSKEAVICGNLFILGLRLAL